jgi:branched-chain amino acid transport system ATP-binding protein
MVALVRGLKGRYTIVVIEHKMDIIMSVSDRISVMHFGSLIAEGTPGEIQRNPEVRRAYLGGVAAESIKSGWLPLAEKACHYGARHSQSS